jgi:hypothetical protein
MAQASASNLADVQAQLRAERRRIEAELGIPDQQRDFAAVAASAKRKRGAGAPLPPEEPLRRSSRATRQAAVFAPTGLAGDGDLAAALGGGGGGGGSSSSAAAAAAPSRVDPVTGQLRPEAPADPGSLRSFRARLDYMTQTYLGKHVPVALAGGGNQAKAAVLWEACARAGGGGGASSSSSSSSAAAASLAPGPRPRFNKYAGLQQYADAAILFANIASDEDGGGAFGNAFGDGGRTITWFASASQHEQTPAILRLRHHATGHTYVPDTTGDGEPVTLAPCGVALVCRLPGQPYVWCGQLELVAMDEGSRPLQFTWRLTHADALRQAPAFRALLDAQGVKL